MRYGNFEFVQINMKHFLYAGTFVGSNINVCEAELIPVSLHYAVFKSICLVFMTYLFHLNINDRPMRL